MTRRSKAREVVLQLLFQRDQNPQVARAAVERFVRDRLRDADLVTFALGLFDGVTAQLGVIDERLAAAAENWRLPRMAGVDRNVLRLGAYELLFTSETPAGAVINEAIELARRYGAAESPAFVNGILDQVHQGSGVRDQESEVRDQESGVRSQESGVRSQGSGVRDQESGVRDQESGDSKDGE